MTWLRKVEDDVFWWLYKRWRAQATVEDLKRHRDWLRLDIHVKGGRCDD